MILSFSDLLQLTRYQSDEKDSSKVSELLNSKVH